MSIAELLEEATSEEGAALGADEEEAAEEDAVEAEAVVEVLLLL